MLSILVVEDSQEKLRKIIQCLTDVSGCSLDNVEIARDIMSAKRSLKQKHFDLLVLDITLPERPDTAPSRYGGVALLEEVLRRDLYHQPREIVGLTAYQEVLEYSADKFGRDLWLVIEYDATSDEWASKLKRKVEHILLAQAGDFTSHYEYDLCVITALNEPELSAVRRLPWNWSVHTVQNDFQTYFEGTFGKNKRVISATTARMGMPASTILAMKMIYWFKPRYLAMVGITGGVRGTCEIGDVVAADPAWDWGSGKHFVAEGKRGFAAAPRQLELDAETRSSLLRLSDDRTTLDKIRANWPGTAPSTRLSLHVAPMASGAAVLSDAKIAEEIARQHRKVAAIEMEAYGVFAAAREAPMPQPRAFVIKSVCDFADEHKEDAHQAYAAYTSAAILETFAERFV